MSKENVEIVRRVYDAVARRETETVLALYDPKVEVDLSRSAFMDPAGGRVFHGHEGLRSLDREWREAFDQMDTECLELIDAGDRVLTTARYEVRGRASGVRVTGPVEYGVWTVDGGTIVRVAWFDTREEALE